MTRVLFECPRCGSSVDEPGAPYRKAQRVLHQCGECEIWIVPQVDPHHLTARLDALSRTSRTLEQRCPRCSGSLVRQMLSNEEREVDIEVCSSCSLIVVDHDEVDAAETLLDIALDR